MSFRPTHYGPGGRRPKRRFAHLRGSCLGTNSGCRGQLDHASLAVRRWQTQVSESSNLERGADSADTDHVGVAGDAGW
jgi:hypothetical protein